MTENADQAKRLQELGRRRQKLVTDLAAVDAELDELIPAVAALPDVQQVDIIKWTGLTRETVRVKSMSPEEREALRAARRKTKA